MRFGEVQALHLSSVFEDHILVQHSWDEKFGLKELEKCTLSIINKNYNKKNNCEFCDLNNKFCKKHEYY